MDNKVLVFLIVSAIAISVKGLPYPQGPLVTVLKDERVPPGKDGSYSHNITLSDGTQIQESGSLDLATLGTGNTGAIPGSMDESPGLVIRGEYTFIDPEGKTHKVTYVADKNGFQPEGDDIPKNHKRVVNNIPDATLQPNITQKAEAPLITISSSLFSSPSAML